MKVVGGKLMDVCPGCARIVRLDKPFIGSTHICTTPEEQRVYAAQIAQAYAATKRALECA